MTALLLGANGQLGQTYLTHPSTTRLGKIVAATRDGRLASGETCEQADLTRSKEVSTLLNGVRPDIIINTAAYNAVDRAEDEPELAFRINSEVVAEIGAWAEANGALVVHFSSDYVFDGQKSTPYDTQDQPRPVNLYGRSKLAGEVALQESGARHLILRTAWVYSRFGGNFMKTMLRLGKERDELRVVADQYGSPTTTRLLVDASVSAIGQMGGEAACKLSGVYHLVAGGSTSWHGFAQAIIKKAFNLGLLDRMPQVTAIQSNEFSSKAKRPAYSVMDSSSFRRTFGVELPDWSDGLDETLTQLTSS